MKKQPKILFISGSPRHGNTDYVLSKIYESVSFDSKELIFLGSKKIAHCRGCLVCHNQARCIIKDDINPLLDKMANADIFVLGAPNYFENVNGLMKNFIDRCHPLYGKSIINGKKIFLIFVGGGETKGTKKYLDLSFFGFIKHLKLDRQGSYSFRALNANDLSRQDISREILKITKKINSLFKNTA